MSEELTKLIEELNIIQELVDQAVDKLSWLRFELEEMRTEELEKKTPASGKVVVFKEADLEKLNWRLNESQTGYWTSKQEAPDLWNAVIAKKGWTLRMGEYVYKIYDSERPFINKFPVKKGRTER